MSSIRDEMTGRYSINGHWNAAQGLRALCHLWHLRQATGHTHQCTWKMHEAGARTNTRSHCIRLKRMLRLHSCCCWIKLLVLGESVNACCEGYYAILASRCCGALIRVVHFSIIFIDVVMSAGPSAPPTWRRMEIHTMHQLDWCGCLIIPFGGNPCISSPRVYSWCGTLFCIAYFNSMHMNTP